MRGLTGDFVKVLPGSNSRWTQRRWNLIPFRQLSAMPHRIMGNCGFLCTCTGLMHWWHGSPPNTTNPLPSLVRSLPPAQHTDNETRFLEDNHHWNSAPWHLGDLKKDATLGTRNNGQRLFILDCTYLSCMTYFDDRYTTHRAASQRQRPRHLGYPRRLAASRFRSGSCCSY